MTQKKIIDPTQGEWCVGEPMQGHGRVVISVGGIGQIAKCYRCPKSGGNRGMSEQEMMANAKLIAAAPKLLEVCKRALAGIASTVELKRVIREATLCGRERHGKEDGSG